MNDKVPTLIPVEKVSFLKEFYIRFKPSDTTIEQYRASIGMFPPIVLARGHILVDGFHRWQAHRREGVAEIAALDLGNLSDLEIKKEAWLLNNAHGFAPSTAERKSACDSFYRDGVKDYAEIAKLVGVTRNTAREYCRDARKDEVETQKAKAWDLWLDCFTQAQIAREVGVDQTTISEWLGNLQKVGDSLKPPGSTAASPWGSVQHFDIWQFQHADKDAGSQSYFGALLPQVVENVLWFYTEPGQVVLDPFAGSGTTIEVAKIMGRRVWASDIRGNHYAPHLPIHQHDILNDWPTDAPKKADLVILDPPYWKQAVGRYSKEPNRTQGHSYRLASCATSSQEARGGTKDASGVWKGMTVAHAQSKLVK